jgi:hypothetical protein
MKRHMVPRYIATGVAVAGICLATGCATQDTVSSRFPGLEGNINAAKAVDAEVYAPVALTSAQARLEQAKSAVAGGDMVSASRFVDEAMADADYARAKAPTEKAMKEAADLRKAIQTLRDEIKKMPAVK